MSSAAPSEPRDEPLRSGSDDATSPARRRGALYGRRRGRPLRAGQQRLWSTLLPRLQLRLPEPGERLDPSALFAAPPGDLWLEIGFGGGEHLAAQAAAHPGIGMIGCEVFENGIVKLLGEIERRRLANIRILTDDGRLLLSALPEASLGRVFILFPDPWPKQRHHKRRLVSTATLDALARVMKGGAELRVATDDRSYLLWMLQRVPTHPAFEWLAKGPADWRTRPADWPATRYEAKAVAAGRAPVFLRLRRRSR
ncbi:MAG TPA: tRNA (guanosine(46)-N7)-methyltransferase TrmB [Stellaceae bacterium]|nr:tRNA (guanosine(46)-N7)-methyltransferase TrmB [Stellaceae bacterium]